MAVARSAVVRCAAFSGRWLWLILCVLAVLSESRADEVLLSDVVMRTADGEQRLAGRVVAEGAAGELLLEDPAGRMRQLSAAEVVGREDRRGVWQPADAEQLGRLLKTEAGSGFEVYQTEHYLVCSNCSEGYNEFIGRLLETVYAQYFDFWKKLNVDVASAGRLNSGLQQRFADFPVWYSEGLSLYFEPPSERSAVLWSRPGQVSPRHHPEFVRLVRDETLPVPLSDLLVNDSAFQSADAAVAAYAESWGLVSYLVKKKPLEFAEYARRLQRLQPLQAVTGSARQQMFTEAIGETPAELSGRLIPWVRRLRVAR